MADQKPMSTPRLKAVPMQSNPDLMIGIGEKGGISVYGLQRFPVTMYAEQWQRLLDEQVTTEILLFAEEHRELLSDGKPGAVKADSEDRTFSIKADEIALVAAESARLTAAGDMPGAVKYATIKAVAEANKGKVSFEQLTDVMTLKAKK